MSRAPLMVAAGGTGGHLFPAMALTQELVARGWEVDLMTDRRGDRFGTDFQARRVHRVPSATFERGAVGKLVSTPVTLARGVLAAWWILRRLRPAAVIGFGGYPTIPPLVAAMLARVPRAVHEQNGVMGRANRLLARHVTAVALSFDGTTHVPERGLAVARVTGNPVRAEVVDAAAAPYAPPVKREPLHLLVFGGSQGARFFADTIPQALGKLPPDVRGRMVVTQQAREEDLKRLLWAFEQVGVAAELAPFFSDLPARMAKAHLVISRSGASTVAELSVLGRPAILVPFPHALDNDQLANATRAAQAGGAWCLEQSDATPERLAGTIARLARDPQILAKAADAARGQGKPNAVALLADLVEELAGHARADGRG